MGDSWFSIETYLSMTSMQNLWWYSTAVPKLVEFFYKLVIWHYKILWCLVCGDLENLTNGSETRNNINWW